MKKNTKLESLFSELFYEKAENVSGGASASVEHSTKKMIQALKTPAAPATADQSWGGPNGEANDCIAD
jgi:hypothetical protein